MLESWQRARKFYDECKQRSCMPKFTAARGDYTFEDAEGVSIHYYVWRASSPKAVVQIVHGVGEYATRYEELAQALTAAGYTVYASDLRGHGQTGVGQYG